jgi:hypothetical protein
VTPGVDRWNLPPDAILPFDFDHRFAVGLGWGDRRRPGRLRGDRGALRPPGGWGHLYVAALSGNVLRRTPWSERPEEVR